MISIRFFILAGALNFSCHAIAATESLKSIEGCQGEACGCTHETKANKEFSLYSEMDLKSKLLGKFKSGTEAKALKPVTKVLDPGKATVKTVSDPKVDLKPGDEVTHIFDMGEGHSKVMHGGKWIEFSNEKVQLNSLKKPAYETWFEVQVGQNHGYSPAFPFMGCLE
jgi:hypothetical protein